MEQFQHLKHHTSVAIYIDSFEEHMIQMHKDHPCRTDNFFLLRFISGLKDLVKHVVKSHNPSTLKRDYCHALQQELAHLSINKQQKNFQNTATRSNQATLPKQNNTFRRRNPSSNPKERGKYWYCPEPWVYGHKCSNIKSIVHAIQMQGHNSSDEEP